MLFNKEEGDIGVVRDKTQRYRDTKHVSLEQRVDEQGEESIYNLTTRVTNPKPKVEERDKVQIPELREYDKLIAAAQAELDATESPKEHYRLRQIIKGLRQDQMALKLSVQQPLVGRRTKGSDAFFYEDTGPVTPNPKYKRVRQNTIDLGDPEHVEQLLKHYSALREHTYEHTKVEMRYILDTLDQLIEECIVNPHFKFILIKKIDGLTYDAISEEMQIEMGLALSSSYLSTIFSKRIPSIIAAHYTNSQEEWEYTFAKKGNYKQCTKCYQNYLREPKFFRKDKKSPDGLSTICKECRRRQDALTKERRNRSVAG